MAEALYRKYRPQTFEEMVGQDRIETTLLHAIESNKLSHAYLFCGPRGTGKTSTARLLAKALLCENGPTTTPDPNCESCKAIAEGTHPDVYELDAASRTGVENVREEIIGRVQFAPTQGRSKIYIIDEVHMLSIAAFNALLKTLEEPPDHVVFILCTTDPQKIPDTILSRCQRFDFKRISHQALVARLAFVCQSEQVEYDEAALDLIAARSDGGMRNALTTLEQLIAFGQGKLDLASAQAALGEVDGGALADLVMHIGQRDAAACFMWLAQFCETGADLARFVQDLAERMRDMYLVALTKSTDALELPQSIKDQIYRESQLFSVDRTGNILAILADLSKELKTSPNTRLLIELALTRMVHPESDLTLNALAERIDALEAQNIRLTMKLDALDGRPVPSAEVQAAAPVAPAEAAAPVGQVAPAGQVAQTTQMSAPAAQVAPAQEPVVSAPVAAAVPAATHVAPAAESPVVSAPAAQVQPSTASAPVAVPAPAAAPAAEGTSPFVSVPGSGELSPKLAAALANPAALQRMWQLVMAELKKEKPAHGVLFLNTRISFDTQAQTLHLAFPPENAFIYNTVQKPEVIEHLKACIHRSCGTDVAFVFDPLKSKTVGTSSFSAPAQAPTPTSAGFVPPRPDFMQGAAAPTQASPQPSSTSVAQPLDPKPENVLNPAAQAFAARQAQESAAGAPVTAPAPSTAPSEGMGVPKPGAPENQHPRFQVPAQVMGTATPSYPEPDEVPLDIYESSIPEELVQEDPYAGSFSTSVSVPSGGVLAASPAPIPQPVSPVQASAGTPSAPDAQAAATSPEEEESAGAQGGYLEPVVVKRGEKKKPPLAMRGEHKQDTSFLEHSGEASASQPKTPSKTSKPGNLNTQTAPLPVQAANQAQPSPQGAVSAGVSAGVAGTSAQGTSPEPSFGNPATIDEVSAAPAVPAVAEPNHDDLNALLAASFGEGIRFTEI